MIDGDQAKKKKQVKKTEHSESPCNSYSAPLRALTEEMMCKDLTQNGTKLSYQKEMPNEDILESKYNTMMRDSEQ